MNRARAGLVVAGLIAVVAVMLWWRPWEGTPSGEEAEMAESSQPDKPARLTASRPRQAPAAIAGTSSEPVRLARAMTREVSDAPTGRFEGTVINWGSGAPVASAEIVFRAGDAAVTVTTDARGEFRFEPPGEGAYGLVSISAEGFLPYAPAWGAGAIGVVARRNVEVDGLIFYLTPTIAYRGLVLDASGKPVAGATVRIVSTGTGQFEMMPIADTFKSGADGRFTFSAPDNSVLEARHPGHGVGRAGLGAAVQISHEMTIKLDGDDGKEATASIAVEVLDPAGNPVSDAQVSAAIPVGPVMARPRAVTDAEGRAELAVPAGARLRLVATASDHSPAAEVVVAGGADSRVEATLTLGTSASIRGRVLGEGGAAVPAFTVVVTRRHGVAESVIKSASFFDANGRFELGGLVAGDYQVSAAAYGYAPAPPVAATASVDSSADSDGVTITLPLGGTLVGTVFDSVSAEPLALARVSVEGSIGGGDSALPIASSVVTDDNGRFELAGLPPGRASIICGAVDHHSRIIGGLTVASGARLGPVDIKLTPTRDGETPQLELAGIGAQLAGNEEGLQVQRLIEGGGAIEAGVVVGDLIIAVDGETVVDVGMAKAIGLIRGPVDTPVELRIRRASGEELSVTAVRRKIRA